MQYNTKEVDTVNAMFDDIAPNYDKLNRILSFGIDIRWRRSLIREVKKQKPLQILDIATGTADLAIALSKLNPTKIVGIDISEGMLKIGKEKICKKNLDKIIELQRADSYQIPFEDSAFDAITIAFGVRNFADLQKSLSECLRVLKNNSAIYILEFSYPKNKILRALYNFYSKFIIPNIGKITSKNKSAYEYLPQTIKEFYKNEEFVNQMIIAGFKECKFKKLSGGIVNIYTGLK